MRDFGQPFRVESSNESAIALCAGVVRIPANRRQDVMPPGASVSLAARAVAAQLHRPTIREFHLRISVTSPVRGSSAAGRRRPRARPSRGPCGPRTLRPSSASSPRGARHGARVEPRILRCIVDMKFGCPVAPRCRGRRGDGGIARERSPARHVAELAAHFSHLPTRIRCAVMRLQCPGGQFSLDISAPSKQPSSRFRADIEAPCGAEIPLAEFLGIGSRCAVRGTRSRGQSEDQDVHVLSSLAILT